MTSAYGATEAATFLAASAGHDPMLFPIPLRSEEGVAIVERGRYLLSSPRNTVRCGATSSATHMHTLRQGSAAAVTTGRATHRLPT